MRSILITGGTGTLGRALTKRMLRDRLSSRICIFSRGEHAQAQMRDEIGEDAPCRWFIGDVRDQPRLKRAMQGVDVVIHAAALKRIETGHQNPVELCRTNIDGTINVVEAAQDAGVQKVLLISSDKAVSPVSAYGTSKAMAEALVLAANNTVPANGPKFAVCRYGNVWCSNGSVVPRWIEMVAGGAEHVPVTDVDCTRFFMRIEEAVDLVLNTISTMTGGELAIPELPAYRIGDLVTAMGVRPIITGLPPWEKKHESMSEHSRSDLARRMTVAELREKLAEVGFIARPNRVIMAA